MKKIIFIALILCFGLVVSSCSTKGEDAKVILLIAEQNIEGPQRAWWASEVDLSTTEAAIAKNGSISAYAFCSANLGMYLSVLMFAAIGAIMWLGRYFFPRRSPVIASDPMTCLLLLVGTVAAGAQLELAEFHWVEECDHLENWTMQPGWLSNPSPSASITRSATATAFGSDSADARGAASPHPSERPRVARTVRGIPGAGSER